MTSIKANGSPPRLSGIAAKIITAYTAWHNLTRHIPKIHRYSVGVKIDALFSDIIELVTTAQFSPPQERSAILARAITRNDVLKTMLYVLLELDSITDTAFIQLCPQLEEIGRLLYGWKNQAAKQGKKI